MLTRRRSQSGMATLEALPILVVFLLLVGYGLGSFGAIHTAILHSIAARAYAFETFRHRTDLTYLRDSAGRQMFQYARIGVRVHGIGVPEKQSFPSRFVATERNISMAIDGPDNNSGRSTQTHNQDVYAIEPLKRATVGVNPIWIMVQYGICLNAVCGDQ